MYIITYPNEILNQKAKYFKKKEKISYKLVNEMYRIMLENDGLGLAGPQIGISKRIIVLMNPFDRKVTCIINPIYEVINNEKEIDIEGCLSIPNIHVPIERYKKINVSGFRDDWTPINFIAENLLSRIIQHEIDHLDGIIMIDKLDFMSKNAILKEYQY